MPEYRCRACLAEFSAIPYGRFDHIMKEHLKVCPGKAEMEDGVEVYE